MKKLFECFKIKFCIIIWIILLILIILVFKKPLISVCDYLKEYSSAIVAFVAILGFVFGQSWLDTSKEKMKGKLDNDIARKYLKAILRVRDSMKIVRNPFISIGEMQAALKKKGFESGDYRDQDKVNKSVYSLRMSKVQEAWTGLEEILVDAEVSWGNEAVNVQIGLDRLMRDLNSTVWLFVNSSETFYKKSDKNHKVLYGSYDENDEFAKNVNLEIEKIRTFLKKHL